MIKKIAFAVLLLCFTAGLYAYNYQDTLKKAIWFFDANKCGPDVAVDNVFNWRGACHVNDGSQAGRDLSGGYHDAGDHVKFGLPQAFSASLLGWTLYEYRNEIDSLGLTGKWLSTLKYFTDYFLASHPDANTFYYQVGDGNADHGYWGTPENQTGTRSVIAPATPANSCSDITGQTAAALALMYLNYKNTDTGYANQCLNAAIEIYNIALNDTSRGTDGTGRDQYAQFYGSSAHYDDLSWGAIWLSVATGNSSYLNPVAGWQEISGDYGGSNFQFEWSTSWDNVTPFVLLKMAHLTGEQVYLDAVNYNLDWFLNQAPRSNFGLPYLATWGPLRYAVAEAGYGYLAMKLLGISTLSDLSDFIVDYIMGTNPANRSYITGVGNNPPIHPHHRANEPNKYSTPLHGIVGGLVGGPDSSDIYEENIDNYERSEVSIDFNSSLVFGLAGIIWKNQGGPTPPPPTPHPVTPTPVSTATLPPGDGSGRILRQYWSGITGTAVSALTSHAGYPDNPTSSSYLTSFEGPASVGDNYGCRVVGYLHPPVSGNYKFWIASDDNGELWLSTNNTPGNKQRIAYVEGYTSSRQWTKFPAQESASIYLNAGSVYYIEALAKEGVGGDNLAVAWQAPGREREVIPGAYLSPYQAGSTAPTPTIPVQTPAATPTPTPADEPPDPNCGSPVPVTPEFSYDGAGEYCWAVTNITGCVNSWNVSLVEINGVDFTNTYVHSSGLPPKIDGKYYIQFICSVSWGHFEIKN